MDDAIHFLSVDLEEVFIIIEEKTGGEFTLDIFKEFIRFKFHDMPLFLINFF